MHPLPLRTVVAAALVMVGLGGSAVAHAQEPTSASPRRWSVGIGAGGFGTITHEIREARSSPLIALRVDRLFGRYFIVDGRVAYTRVPVRPSAAPVYDPDARPNAHLELADLSLQLQLPRGRFRPYIGAGGGVMHDGSNYRGAKLIDFTMLAGGARFELSALYSAAAGLRFRNAGDALRNWDWEIGLSRQF